MNVTRKLGANRGATRLWLEGPVLLENGLRNGDRWSLYPDDNGITVVSGPEGERKIAGTPDRPIIDINSSKTLAVLGVTGDKVRVICNVPGTLRIVKEA